MQAISIENSQDSHDSKVSQNLLPVPLVANKRTAKCRYCEKMYVPGAGLNRHEKACKRINGIARN